MKLARYIGAGRIDICDEPIPECPKGGLLVKAQRSGLCSGELMPWYMDAKIPHVLGHEVCGKVIESNCEVFPIGSMVVPHHHAPCLNCEMCKDGLFVHCETWRKTKLIPGGMAEYFTVPQQNLIDCHIVNDLDPNDAALTEPLACIAKSIRQSGIEKTCLENLKIAVIGLGIMGILHLLALKSQFPDAELVGYEISESRLGFARQLHLNVKHSDLASEADYVFVCPGLQATLDLAIKIIRPCGTILLFAPFAPNQKIDLPINDLYFKDISIVSSYSAGPNDMAIAIQWMRSKRIRSSMAISDYISLDELPDAYMAMREGRIVKPMVVFDRASCVDS